MWKSCGLRCGKAEKAISSEELHRFATYLSNANILTISMSYII
jgi:hypothetical protein